MADADKVLEQLKQANERVVTLRGEYQDLWNWYKEGGYQFIILHNDPYVEDKPELPDDLQALSDAIDAAKEEQSRLRIVWREALDQRHRV